MQTNTGQTPLSEEESNYLKEREDIVDAGLKTNLKTTIEAAKALYEIDKYEGPNRRKLWRVSGSFVDYCHQKWGYGQTQAYYQRNAGEFLSRPGIEILPANPAQLKELLKKRVPCEIRVEGWNWVVTEAAKDRPNEANLGTIVAGLTGGMCDALVLKFLVTKGLVDAVHLAEKQAKQERKKVMKAIEVLRTIAIPGDAELPALLAVVELELSTPERFQIGEAHLAEAHSALAKLKGLVSQRDAELCSRIEKNLGDLKATLEGSSIFRGTQKFDEVRTAFHALKQACQPVVRRIELSRQLDALFGVPPPTLPVSNAKRGRGGNLQSGRRGSSSPAKASCFEPNWH